MHVDAAGMTQPESEFCKLSLPLVQRIVELGFPGHSMLMAALVEQSVRMKPRKTRFRVCVRKRPLLPFEAEVRRVYRILLNEKSSETEGNCPIQSARARSCVPQAYCLCCVKCAHAKCCEREHTKTLKFRGSNFSLKALECVIGCMYRISGSCYRCLSYVVQHISQWTSLQWTFESWR